MKRLVRSSTQKLASERGPVFLQDDAHPHEAYAGDPAREPREGKYFRPPRRSPPHPPAEGGPDEEEQPVVPVKSPRETRAGGRRDEMLPRRKDPGEQGEDYADEPPDRDAPDLHRSEGGQPLRERDGDGAPGLRRGRGKLVGAEHARVGDEQPEAQHAHERPHEDAGELGDELRAATGAQEIAALEAGEEICAAPRRGT